MSVEAATFISMESGRSLGSMRSYITRLIWLCMTPLLAVGAYLAIDRVREVQAERVTRADKLSHGVIDAVNDDLEDRTAALRLLATSPLVDDTARAGELYAEALRYREIFGGDVIFANTAMDMVWNTRVPFGTPLPKLPRPAGRAAVPLALASGKPAVGDVFMGPVAQKPLVAIAVPVLRGAKVTALLLTTFDAAILAKRLDKLTLAPGWSIALVDGQGVRIAHAVSPEGDAIAGEARRKFEARSALSGWSIVVDIPIDSRRNPISTTAIELAFAILAATLMGVLGGQVGGRRLGALLASFVEKSHPDASARDMAEFADVRRQLGEASAQRAITESTLRDNEWRFRRLFDQAPVPQALVDEDGALTSVNTRFVEVFGYSLVEVPTLEAWWSHAYPDRDSTSVRATWTEALKGVDEGGSPIAPVERHVTCKDGTTRDVVVSSVRIGDEFLFTFFDVTERHRADAALRQSAALYQRTLDSMLEGCQIVGLDWRYLYVNEAAVRQNRQNKEALFGRTMQEVYPGIEATEAFALLRRCMERREAQQSEIDFQFPDGSRAWFDLNVQAVPEGIAIFSVEITQRKLAEDANRRLAAIVESSDDAIIGKTLDGVITSWNKGAERLFGYAAGEAVGQPLMMLIPDDRKGEEPEILRRIALGESVDHFETVRVRKDGTLRDVAATISPIRDTQGRIVGASKIARDITEERLTQVRLRAQLERLNLLDQITSAVGERQELQSIYDVVLATLEDRLPVDFCCVCEYDAASSSLVVIAVGPRSRASATALELDLQARIDIDGNGLSRCVQGDLVYEPDISASDFAFPNRFAREGLLSLVMAPLRSESRIFGVLVASRRAARSVSSGECEFLRQLSAHVALAVRHAQLYGALQRAYDELRQTQQAVMQQERLRALGEMASGIAHDINNAISPVLLYTETLLERETQLSEKGRGYLQTIARSIDDVAATVARLREFYRQREPQLSLAPLDVNRLVEQVIDLTQARWRDMPQQHGVVIRLEPELTAGLPGVSGVESETREALINLVFNAVDAMPEGGVLTLRTSRDDASFVHIDVIDTGIGMDEDTRVRCLEPFFTTKGERGTGLGLAMVYGFAQRHGAELKIASLPGHGTTIRLSFPIPIEPIAESTEPQAKTVVPCARLRILIVDDDPIVLKALGDALLGDGHVVVPADGGREGIATFRGALATASAFDAVITDLGMPHADGRQVASAVKASSPSTPVIMLTGWGQRLIADNEIPPHVDRVFSKPPKLRDLRLALAELTPTRGDAK